ncbi:TetR family transcriptional regulator C-terminal domain-containing protein [Marivibrio halodurans]|uniref:TetR family transcriptional regulator C-terminal domain-containing protein n=1 Tax=Marivibrio halodurans TaxID=2039722 RepID=A0A8J7SKS4_9PROT|nr:TetR family transcriptional regulator C-terminal domain-containing protein [Marivibrio halodurans]MBP5855711.1 TetR family transcriptional regulator C-terminal domain-containing protein [Marivibrio halodurans]
MAKARKADAPTTRIEKKEATRQQLIAATVEVIAADGFADMTLAKVSQRANVSRGLVNFHFTSKERLLVETLRHLTEEYRASWSRAIAGPRTARDKLLALIRADFSPRVCNRKKIAVWYAFWGEAKSRPTYLEVCAKADGAFAQTVEELCVEIAREGGYAVDAALAARGLRCITDGLWLELLMAPQQFRRDIAIRTCLQYLAALFPNDFLGSEYDHLTQAVLERETPA